MKVLIAADHAGFDLKTFLIEEFKEIEWEDCGTFSKDSVDYPDYASKLCKELKEKQFGVLICGSGIGMSIAANRFPHVRAALCSTPDDACFARAHNNANVIIFGGRVMGHETAKACLSLFLKTPFDGGRHLSRLQRIKDYGI